MVLINKNLRLNRISRGILLCAILLFFLIIYLYHLTSSGLWYDEGIEYFYSKYMFGPLPGTLEENAVGTDNMYQRICTTFQPPLYNFLMYFWLLVYDGEKWFRLAGVVVTFVGALGLYGAIRKITSYWWALIGVIVYLCAWSVWYYALECGEYNLMLCMECWTLYFVCAILTEQDDKKRKRSVLGFVIFACLSVYSQYGAALLIVPLFVSIVASFAIERNWEMVRYVLVCAIMSFFVAAVPLVIFFTLPQMQHMGISNISHMPVFVGSVFNSIKIGVNSIINFNVHDQNTILAITIRIFILISVVAVVIKNKKVRVLMGSTILAYIFYFSLVATSYYAYNSWNGALGCYNFGGYGIRYTLFLTPILIISVLCVYYYIILYLRRRRVVSLFAKVLLTFLFIVYSAKALSGFVSSPIRKDNVRELYNCWLKHGGDNNLTLVFNRDNPVFQFYYLHGNRPTHPYNVIGLGNWSFSSNPEDFYIHFKKAGIYKHTVVNYVGQVVNGRYNQKNVDKAMLREDYNVDYLFNEENILARYVRDVKNGK